ncbi:MAG: dihydroorotate dehydrogenase electron transfer subunit [Bacillaceae bacterium]|nr:dihydroorotate dehydrogenase electron transfer subunit [Bacillaceae bacterium]
MYDPTGQETLCPAGVEDMTVVTNERIAERIFRMTLAGNLVDKMVCPGQFVHVKCGSGSVPLLRRPISISDVDADQQQFTMIYRVEGEGTRLLSRMHPGEQVNVLGPLGQGYPIKQRKSGEHAVLVGGGVGVPPLYYLGRKLVEKGVRVTSVIGFGSREQVFLENELKELGDVYVTTMDGSHGTRGLVTDVLTVGDVDPWDVLYSCGPIPMLKALQELYGKEQTEAYISLEQRMGCGVGACLACVCHPSEETRQNTGKRYFKICSDGPVFGLREVAL